jgi:hypothetical protein
MALMALFGLIYALATQSIRRGHDKVKPPPESINVPLVARLALGVYIVSLVYVFVRGWLRRGRQLSADEPSPRSCSFSVATLGIIGLVLIIVVILTSRDRPGPTDNGGKSSLAPAVAPADLPALGYLPDDTKAAIGIHLAEILADRANKPYIDELLLVASVLGLGDVEKWSGLALDDLDHVVVGWHAKGKVFQATIVVRTRRPYNTEAISKALKISSTGDIDKKPVYSFDWDKDQRALCWCADSQTLVFVIAQAASQGATLKTTPPRAGSARLPASLRRLFMQRSIPAGSPLWIAGRPGDANALSKWLALTPLPLEFRAHLSGTQEFAIGVRLDSSVVVTAALHASDNGAARELEQFLAKQQLAETELRVSRQSPQDDWLTIQLKTSPKGIKQWFVGKKEK